MITDATQPDTPIPANPLRHIEVTGKTKTVSGIVLVLVALIAVWLNSNSSSQADTIRGSSQVAATSVTDTAPRVRYFPSQYPPITAADSGEQPATF
jgi:hypothetical protein